MEKLIISLVGITIIFAIAYLLSENRKSINVRIIIAAFFLQFLIAYFVLTLNLGKLIIEKLSDGARYIIDFSQEGVAFVFGPLANEWSFAINALPVVIFLSALTAVLYHLRVMQFFVSQIGGLIKKILGTNTIESMNAAANIFLGMDSSPLAVKPYLSKITDAQMFAIMVSGLASVAGTVLLAYAQMGAQLEYLLAACFMSAPGGLMMAKIIFPDDTQQVSLSDDLSMDSMESPHTNIIMAAAVGASDGVKLAVSIAAMLIAFVALIALTNSLFVGLGSLIGIEGLTMQKILGWVFSPIMFLLNIPWDEAQAAGALFGEKLILNEFVAFSHLNEYLSGMSEKTTVIVTFALCGFANFASIGILMGSLGILMPEKKEFIARYGLKAVLAGSLANLMSAAFAGLLFVS
ncbi:MAG: nucleoside transporter C-terminal domain-containing protein [Woeseiaceae bacterium]|jgi:concentrative nucleoside transporter, CNT family|nr:NupC/NupG family nucleoside CNT transporter [Woeseiaceae bacterium]MDG1016421.1 nucleoside transporter C-terminal domain-containing protein [Woeseiaceae bacterium]MDG1865481.1 nucleoside transporter C-terminal domain-containing protein [Woeseiaceae bacterium]